MSYCLVVFDKELAEKDNEPFITLYNSPEYFVLGGVVVFGPYKTIGEASDAGRTLSGSYTWAIRAFHSLSEELDNPAGAMWWGDSPDNV